MLKIKAWIVIQEVGTKKNILDRKIVFSSNNFDNIVKFLESKENIFDTNYWKNRRTKRGVIGHRNDNWIAYNFYTIRIML